MSNKLAIILVNWNSYELTKNTFNLKYRYISKINELTDIKKKELINSDNLKVFLDNKNKIKTKKYLLV